MWILFDTYHYLATKAEWESILITAPLPKHIVLRTYKGK